MKILVLHNHYQHTGGEDVAVRGETELLATHGHDVTVYTVSNTVVRTTWDKAKAAWRSLYSTASRRQVAKEIHRFRPDVVHVHNFFPLLSPSIYDACRAAGVSVVQTLHNYRLLCLNALFFREGRVCEACLGKTVPWPGMLHACYRRDRGASGAIAAMQTIHRFRQTWSTKVNLYIALTEFARNKFIQGGLPGPKIVVKPNFVPSDPGMGTGCGGYALFVGRLSPEKGLDTLLTAWRLLGRQVPLKIVGDGPLAGYVDAMGREVGAVERVGACSHRRVASLMKDARVLVFPSLCYEGFPMVIAEAYAAGLPVVATNLGSMSLLVDHGRTGLHVRPNDPADLAAKLQWLWARPGDRARMSENAREEFERKYTAEHNYEALMSIYALATNRTQDASPVMV